MEENHGAASERTSFSRTGFSSFYPACIASVFPFYFPPPPKRRRRRSNTGCCVIMACAYWGGGDERENLHDNGPIPAFASREFSQHKNQQFHFAAAEAAVAAIKHRSFLFFVFFFSSSSSSSCSMCFKNRRQLVVLLFFFLHGNRITSAFSCSSCSSHSTYWKPKYADNI